MAWETPEGYRWITVHGKRVLIKDKNFDYTLEHDNYGSSGNWTDNTDSEINEFVSDTELFEYRRDKQIEAFEEEASRLNEEERKRDDYKKQINRKPPRQAMKKQYNVGDIIKINGESYSVAGAINHTDTGKLLGYVTYDSMNRCWYVDRFGGVKDWDSVKWDEIYNSMRR